LVHLVVENFHFENSAFADPKNIPMVQEAQRKRKAPALRRTGIRFPVVVPKTDTDELYVSPGSAIVEVL
jgi:hypothetical protein